MRRAEVGDGAESRRTKPVDEAVIDRFHNYLARVEIELPQGKTTTHIRNLMRVIREKRNGVGKVLSYLHRTKGSLSADLTRLERIFDAEKNLRYDRGDCFAGTTNDKQREARVRSVLSQQLDACASLKGDLALVGEALAHARLVLDELRGAFDEASRLLASIELDWRIAGNQ